MGMYYCSGCDYYHDSKGGAGYNAAPDGKQYCDEEFPEQLPSEALARKVGDFDAYVQDMQEKMMRERYQDYLDEGDDAIPAHEWPASAMSFDEFCSNYDPTN